MSILYNVEPELSVAEFIDILQRSGLAARRPTDRHNRIEAMLAGADLIVTARDAQSGGKLIGVARSVTDQVFACYCSDLAVDADHQGNGVGRDLILSTQRQLHEDCKLYVVATPEVEAYCAQLGMTRMAGAFEWTNPA